MNMPSKLTVLDCLMTAIAMTVTLTFMHMTIAQDTPSIPTLTASNDAAIFPEIRGSMQHQEGLPVVFQQP
jgi:hypothetical protein